MSESRKTVAIIGAGPVGLAAAAHAIERNLRPVVLEAGPEAGYAVRQWSHVRMFSPWAYNIDKAAERLLVATGWNAPDPESYPTGSDLIEHYIAPLATRTVLREHIKTSSRVTAIGKVGFDKVKTKGREGAPFEIRFQNGKGPETIEADAVIDASGTWASPNPAGANGLAAIGEAEQARRIAYGMPDVRGADRARYAGKTVAVLGAGHSAIGTVIDLVALKEEAPGTIIIWLLRGNCPEKAFGGGANDKLSARGELGSTFARLVADGHLQAEAAFRVTHLTDKEGRLRIASGPACGGRHVIVDELIVATGFRPELGFLRELRLSLDLPLDCPTVLAPLIDPNEHSCGTVRPHGARELTQPETGFYIAGMKSYGRAPTFLALTGYEQVRSIVADIAGDQAAADRVELVLPETGVCLRSPIEGSADCCGGPAEVDACCRDETAKAVGQAGCGCNTANASQPKRSSACCGRR
ncbi:MAG: NAD(P)-binding domain-containing protein [Hyphomicrobiaceae bacterium]